ncbi:TetR/AcrR family transcriptional regulator [Kineococcus radiotolerans]|uniref:Transcriptional regulator, TetR family n=1 Tax=Kineococcus radiotolerans (strain ATCC BAA-149 / DSM 14245 / SRS30216) TaxID=266940 RepID=A6WBJ0_KINRD|nr:TetR/AcrR family transcriptional regulator [Kineococcus radiotolerans]ABS04179.1 transcriptional regulator, TetR family [Kineococcus radiotolerans SRS30216 = ATCC BAA-149]
MNPRSTYHHGDLRAALVAAARELVAEKGVAGLSVAEAARRAGVSAAAPYRHFDGRAALLSAAATDAGRHLRAEMQAALEQSRCAGDPTGALTGSRGEEAGATGGRRTSDPVADAVDQLATLARVYVRFQRTHGAAFELILADELHEIPDEERREVTRTLFDLLLSPAMTITGDVRAANPLLRSFSAVVNGFSQLSSSGVTRGYPVDLRGFPDEGELAAAEAAHAVRVLARAAAEPVAPER